MSRNVSRDVYWAPWDGLGCEHAHLAAGPEGRPMGSIIPLDSIGPAAQRYTCLKPLGPDGGLYRYEGRFRGFSAELPVDSDGLVIDYPETFRRIWPT